MNQFDSDRHRALRRLKLILDGSAGAFAIALLGASWLCSHWLAGHVYDIGQLCLQADNLRARGAEVHSQHQLATTKLVDCKRKISEMTSRLGNAPDEHRFIAQLSAAAEKCGLNLTSVRPGGVSVHGAHSVLELRIACEGSYDALYSFLSQVDEGSRCCHVAGMDVALADPQAGLLKIELQVQLPFAREAKENRA